MSTVLVITGMIGFAIGMALVTATSRRFEGEEGPDRTALGAVVLILGAALFALGIGSGSGGIL